MRFRAEIVVVFTILPIAHAQTVYETREAGAFPLVANGRAATILVGSGEAKVVQIAAGLLADDVRRVAGPRPLVSAASVGPTLVVGTLGVSPLLDGLAKRGKLDVGHVRGRWEAYTIARVTDAVSGLKDALVVAGADRRGTAYGLLSLSEAVGVSPWVWWADVPAPRKKALYVALGKPVVDAPAVRYRGIFINDEDWGMQPWSAKTIEPETKDIGPRTYAHVFELMLRLRANCVWPAMHPSTKAFNLYPQNKLVADDYAIVMGASHAEPMLRNNVSEWDEKTRGPYDYTKNRDGVYRYWDERVAENGRFENLYTIGMRGIHDSEIAGGGTVRDKVARLETIFADQRAILAKHVDSDPAKVPQVFVPYKEVLPLYEAGLRVPDDVTLMWPDDNYGYVRHLPTPEERQRPGGSGVYYHASYWGVPNDYLWLGTTPPALIWEEMRKAYDLGARRAWILNVGDLKPAEIAVDFFLRLAWNPEAYERDAQPRFLREWATRTFGPAASDGAGAILQEYYRLNLDAKPEFLHQRVFALKTPNGADARLRRFADLVARTERFYAALPAPSRDAAFELVVYPVRCAAAMNVKTFEAQRSRMLRAEGKIAEADTAGAAAQTAYETILRETRYYNETLARGKWRWMMSEKPRGLREYGPPDLTKPAKLSPPAVPTASISIDAAKPSRNVGRGGVAWKAVADLGHRGDAMAIFPSTALSVDVAELRTKAPGLEYRFDLGEEGMVEVATECLPTFAIDPKRGLRYAVAIDDEAPQVVDLATKEYGPGWAERVLQNKAVGRTKHRIHAHGRHTLRVWMVDPGLVLDRFEVGVKRP